MHLIQINSDCLRYGGLDTGRQIDIYLSIQPNGLSSDDLSSKFEL